MRVLITGGAGMIGRKLVNALLAKGSLVRSDGSEDAIGRIVVSDVAAPDVPLPEDPRVEAVYGDFSDPGAAESLLGGDTDAVFHLAAVVSGQAEQEFDLGLRINLHGTERLLQACRALPAAPRFLFASSVAAYGGDMPDVIADDTPLRPQTSYGSQKAMCELMINDCTRKGFVDGRVLRLPTIVIRPGKANAAASSFASALLREPLQGDRYTCPIKGDTAVWILSPRRAVGCFVHAAELPASDFAPYCGLALPGITVTVDEMVAALREAGGDAVADRVSFEPDPFIERIVYGWPTHFAPRRAEALGFVADRDIREVVEVFVEDDLPGGIVR